MNSIFSSFDAVCAEFLGQTVKASLPSCTNKGDGRIQSQRLSRELKATENLGNNNLKEGNSFPPPPADARKRPQQQKPAARFAPELDGLHCFETLVFY